MTKYVLSSTLNESPWENCVFLKSVDDIRKLKQSEGGDIKVWGSGELIQLLLAHDLVDELNLRIHPLTLGRGKKLWGDGPIPAAFTLRDSAVNAKGVISASYVRAGEVRNGTVGSE